MLLLLGLQRVSYLGPAIAGLASPAYRSTAVNAGLLAGAVVWNVWLFVTAARHGWFSTVQAWLDGAVGVILLLVMAGNLEPATGGIAPDWASRMAQGSAALLGAAIARRAGLLVALGGLIAAQVVATGQRFGGTPGLAAEQFHAVSALVCFAVVVGFGVRYLRLEGRHLENASASRLVAEC